MDLKLNRSLLMSDYLSKHTIYRGLRASQTDS